MTSHGGNVVKSRYSEYDAHYFIGYVRNELFQKPSVTTDSYTTSFICYSDFRLHCPHIHVSTNKMYIVNTPSPFELISHSINFNK